MDSVVPWLFCLSLLWLLRSLLLVVEVAFFFLFEAVAPQEVGEVLREGGARHDGIAPGLDGLGLQVALDVAQEADDGGAGRSLSSAEVSAAMASLSELFTKRTLTPILRAVSLIFARKNRSSMKK